MDLFIIVLLGVLIALSLGGRTEPQPPLLYMVVPQEPPRQSMGCLPIIIIAIVILAILNLAGH